MTKDFNIIVFISGRGSNLAGLIKSRQNYNIQAVISNNPSAAGLEIANQAGIQSHSFDRKNYNSIQDLKADIRNQVIKLQPNLLVLAGYMLLIEPELLELFPGQIVNIHPSLLPDYMGLDTHSRVLSDKKSIHGCTVHQVDASLDTGAIISQKSISVLHTDNEESLAARLLKEEHMLYPWTINNIASGDIILSADKKPTFSLQVKQQAIELGYKLGD